MTPPNTTTNRQTTANPHLNRVHRRRLADHAQAVLLSAVHLVLALLSHRSCQPHPMRVLGLGCHCRDTDFGVGLGVGPFAIAIAVVGLAALSANQKVCKFADFPAAVAVNDLW